MLNYNKTFYKLFISYLIIFAIPMAIIGIVNYYQTLQIIEDKFEKDSIAALKQSSYIVDSFVEKLYKLSSELSLNERVYNYLYTKPDNVRDLNILAREVMLDLREYTILNDFIRDIYVYSEVNNAIVSPTGLYTPEVFFTNIYSNAYNKTGFDEWLYSLGKPSFRKFTPITINSEYNGMIEKIMFKDSLPNIRDNLGCIMVFVNKAQYMNAFSDVLKEHGGTCYILDEDLQIIFSDNTQKHADLIITKIQSSEGASVITTSDGKALMVYISSTKNKWKYVSIIPYDAFTKEINNLKLSIISIIAIFTLLAFLVSLFAANKNYKPVKNIVDFIKVTYGYKDSECDDYEVISNILESSYNEIKLNREILKNYIPIIKQGYLVRFLKESGEVEKNQSNYLNTLLDIHLDFSVSTVVLFNIKRIVKEGDYDTKKELYKIALRTAIEKLVEYNHVVYAVELEHDNIACIYGLKEANAHNAQKNIFTFVMNLKDYLESKLDAVLYVGIGNTYKGYKDLHRSYEESDEALNYAVLMNEDIVFYKDIFKNNNLFAFPVYKELQLVNFIKAGKQDEALDLINTLYNENFINKELTYEMMKFFIYDLYCSIIKAAGELNLECNDQIISSIKEIDTQNSTLRDMSFFLLDIKRKVIYICKEINTKRKNKSFKLKSEIIKYVDENFLDSQLSLEKIADEFNITPQYLSRFFKEHFNMSYVDYVNNKRVNKAKEYLLSNEKVKDTAFKSGFNNIGTFINAFKKYTGFTPGEYKKNA